MRKNSIFLNIVLPLAFQFLIFVIGIILPDIKYTVAMIVPLLITPSALTIVNLYLLIRKIEISAEKCFIFMLIGLLLGNFISYFIWGVLTQRLLSPDSKTISLTLWYFVYCFKWVGITYLVVKSVMIFIRFRSQKQ